MNAQHPSPNYKHRLAPHCSHTQSITPCQARSAGLDDCAHTMRAIHIHMNATEAALSTHVCKIHDSLSDGNQLSYTRTHVCKIHDSLSDGNQLSYTRTHVCKIHDSLSDGNQLLSNHGHLIMKLVHLSLCMTTLLCHLLQFSGEFERVHTFRVAISCRRKQLVFQSANFFLIGRQRCLQSGYLGNTNEWSRSMMCST